MESGISSGIVPLSSHLYPALLPQRKKHKILIFREDSNTIQDAAEDPKTL